MVVMSDICVNKVINNLETGEQFLVLWLAPGNRYGYWYDLNSSSRKPDKFYLEDVLPVENGMRYELSDYETADIRDENSISETDKVRRDRLWAMVQAAVEYEPEIYERSTRAEILRMVSEEHGVKPSNLYPLLDKYWRSGKTKNAFIPAYNRCGSKGSVRNPTEKRIGRKPQDGTSESKIITETDRDNFAAAVKLYYLNRNKLSFTVVYEKLLADFYSIKAVDKSGQKLLLPPNERPSLRQFRYWYNKQRDLETEQKRRDGEKAFELTGRGVLGKSDFGLMGPGAQFQIDATVGDIYLVSQFDRSNLIGRPVLYFVIDVFSRMVTGMSVGIEGPSWMGMAGAIANMAADKVSYCKEYGIEITESEWPCRHVPSVLRGDRGELIDLSLKQILQY